VTAVAGDVPRTLQPHAATALTRRYVARRLQPHAAPRLLGDM